MTYTESARAQLDALQVKDHVRILALETSCDETAAAIIEDGRTIVSNIVFSQIDLHALYGGVVPEIASRAHVEACDRVIDEALRAANMCLQDVDALAVTYGPGLVGALLTGVSCMKGLSYAANKPLIPVNHIEGHVSANYISNPDLKPPFLCLVVSGGHSHIVSVNHYGSYELLGGTTDDAAGEAFDKVAKMLGLGYPGGPMIEKMAEIGDENRFVLPHPLKNSNDCNLSFSGLKTAVRKIIESYDESGNIEHVILSKKDTADICACFQKTAAECLTEKLAKAADIFRQKYPAGKHLVAAGGVAANGYLRRRLEKLAEEKGLLFAAPPLKWCTDNGAMIAWAGLERFAKGLSDGLDFKPRPRWPLDETAPKAAGAGGVKA